MSTSYTLRHDAAARRYEFDIEGDRAVIEYIRRPGILYLTHTGVPPQLEGRGIGSQLVRAVLEEARKEGLRVVPQCPFVARWIERHPEWEELVAKEFVR